jgi:hypothetical protein
MNGITAFLDMSNIYASGAKWAGKLRNKNWSSRKCRCSSRRCERRWSPTAWCLGTLLENKKERWNLPSRWPLALTLQAQG